MKCHTLQNTVISFYKFIIIQLYLENTKFACVYVSMSDLASCIIFFSPYSQPSDHLSNKTIIFLHCPSYLIHIMTAIYRLPGHMGPKIMPQR